MKLINNCAACSGVMGVGHVSDCPPSLRLKKTEKKEIRSDFRNDLYTKVHRWSLHPRRINAPLWLILGFRSEKACIAFIIDNKALITSRTSKYHEENNPHT